jgi:hypothetical protein
MLRMAPEWQGMVVLPYGLHEGIRDFRHEVCHCVAAEWQGMVALPYFTVGIVMPRWPWYLPLLSA